MVRNNGFLREHFVYFDIRQFYSSHLCVEILILVEAVAWSYAHQHKHRRRGSGSMHTRPPLTLFHTSYNNYLELL